MSNKQLDITCTKTARANIGDLKTWGDSDLFKLLAKASSDEGGWMKTTKAMALPTGVLIQTETQQRCGDETTTMAVPAAMAEAALGRFAADGLTVVGEPEATQVPSPDGSGEMLDVVAYTLKRKGTHWALSQSTEFVPGLEIAEEVIDGQVVGRQLVLIGTLTPVLSPQGA